MCVIPDAEHDLEASLLRSRKRLLREVTVVCGISTNNLSIRCTGNSLEIGLIALLFFARTLRRCVSPPCTIPYPTRVELTSCSFVPKAKPMEPRAAMATGAAARAVAAMVEKRILSRCVEFNQKTGVDETSRGKSRTVEGLAGRSVAIQINSDSGQKSD